VRPGTDGQVVFGLRNFEFPEKDSGHAVVVVLAGVDEKLVQGFRFKVQGLAVVGGYGAGNSGGFNELRPRAYDCANFHIKI